MELGFVIITIVTLAIGILIGIAIGKTKKKVSNVCGVVHVDCSDPTHNAWLYLEANVPITEIASRRQVTFDVNVVE